jgi:hypothetical protein
LTTAACSGLRPEPDCRPRRTNLHLSYSCASPFGPAILVTHDHSWHEHEVLMRAAKKTSHSRIPARFVRPIYRAERISALNF